MKNHSSIIKNVKLKSLGCLSGVLLGFIAAPAFAGTIANTAHDFSGSGWSGGEICVACHTPHNANASVTDAPLWNHNLSTQTYTLYDSPTLDSTTVQPTGTSKLCLSCHDGTVAYDNTTNGTRMSGPSAIGSDQLNNDHPISITYDSTLATTDGALHNPSVRTATIGSGTDTKQGTLAQVMLIDNQVQCASCHDVHNKFTDGDKLLKISNSGSALCLTCHNK